LSENAVYWAIERQPKGQWQLRKMSMKAYANRLANDRAQFWHCKGCDLMRELFRVKFDKAYLLSGFVPKAAEQ
jgi:hypothetical protein